MINLPAPLLKAWEELPFFFACSLLVLFLFLLQGLRPFETAFTERCWETPAAHPSEIQVKNDRGRCKIFDAEILDERCVPQLVPPSGSRLVPLSDAVAGADVLPYLLTRA